MSSLCQYVRLRWSWDTKKKKGLIYEDTTQHNLYGLEQNTLDPVSDPDG